MSERLARFLRHALAVLLSALFLLPLWWVIVASLREPGLPPPNTVQWWPAANSHACAVCGCGDPTLTVAGAEKPLAQRVRTGAEVRVLEDRWADVDGGETVMRDARVTALVAYAPLRSIIFVAAVAGVVRDVTLPNLARVVTAAGRRGRIRS